MTCLHGIHQRKLDHRVLLARAGINPSSVEQSTNRVHIEQVARLFRLVQQELDDEFMGFTARPCKYGVFAMLCELLNQGPHAELAVVRVQRVVHVIHGRGAIEVRGGDTLNAQTRQRHRPPKLRAVRR